MRTYMGDKHDCFYNSKSRGQETLGMVDKSDSYTQEDPGGRAKCRGNGTDDISIGVHFLPRMTAPRSSEHNLL